MKALIGFIGFICPAWGADELAFLGMRSAACHRFEDESPKSRCTNDQLRAVIHNGEALEDEQAGRGVEAAPEAGSPSAQGQASRAHHVRGDRYTHRTLGAGD